MKVSIGRIFLALTALVVGFLAIKYTLANLSYLKVDAYIARWQESKTLTQQELNEAFIASEAMLNRHGHHPHYLNTAAVVYEWQAYKDRDNQQASHQSLAKALALYQKSAVLRPHWPLTWASMANIKAELGALDKDFYQYIDNAITYGPYMQEVNLQIAKLFLLYGRKLSEFSFKSGIEQVNHALNGNKSRYTLRDYAKAIGKEQLLCTIGRVNKNDWIIHQHICK